MQRFAPKPRMLVDRKRIDHFLSYELTDRLTPVDKLFTTSTLGIPDVSAEDWSLEITGLVNTPARYTYDELKALPKRELETFYVCSGNPKKPTTPLRRASNVNWAGVDLALLLNELGIDERATHLWSYGLDFGPEDAEDDLVVAHYIKDMPLSRLDERDVLIAYELNGAPLTQKNGFPARLLIPGYYGTNSTKWLCRLELADSRVDSYHTTTIYNDPDYDADPSGKITKPVWALAPECLFASHENKSKVKKGEIELWGWAWSNCPADWVEISVDGGNAWDRAELELATGRSWQRFSYLWTPDQTGEHRLRCRTQDVKGNIQPGDSARNCVQDIVLTVTD